MLTYKIMENVDPREWNSNLLRSSYSTFYQTAEYLSQIKSTGNMYPVFIYVFDDDRIVLGQLGLIIQLYFNPYSTPMLRKLTQAVSIFGHRGSWVSGPIIHSDARKTKVKILKTLLVALDTVAENNRLILLDGYSPPQDFEVDEEYKTEFRKNNYLIRDLFTLTADLSKSKDELWNGIKRTTRQDILRAQKRNIKVREIESKKDLVMYYDLLKRWARTKGIERNISPGMVDEYYEYYNKGLEKIFLAYEDSEPISGLRIGCFNGIACYHEVVNSYSKPSNLGGPLINWHAMQWAKDHGLKTYDFSGGATAPTDKKKYEAYKKQWETLIAYKRKWSGEEFPYYHFLKIVKPVAYKIYRATYKIDWLYRNYKKK